MYSQITSGFRCAPAPNVSVASIFYGFSANFTVFKENEMAAEKIWTFLRLKDTRKKHFCTLSMIWATFCIHQNHCYFCMFFSVASPKVLTLSKINFDEVTLYWLHFRSGRSILIDLSVSNCSYSLAKKDVNLRPVAHKTHEIFARELVTIYEIKIPAI